jgi:tetratricopeptide (TPR) repeat protein
MTRPELAVSATTRLFAAAFLMINVLLIHGPIQAQTPQQLEWCYGKDGAPPDPSQPELLLDACTAIIQSGTNSARDVAAAFTNRGFGYWQTHQRERALNDFNRAINLDADYLPAYCGRGSLYHELGEITQAIPDFDHCRASTRLPALERA